MKWVIVAVVVIALAAGGGYYYWTTSPLYAFQAIGSSVATHNVEKFRASIDMPTLIDSAIKDLISEPIVMTPGLNDSQVELIRGASDVARPKIAEALSDEVIFAINPGQVPPERPLPSPIGEGGPGGRVKHAAYEKMSEYAQAHPQSIPSRIFNIPQEQRKGELKSMLATYGFTPENFRGAKCIREEGDRSVVEATFFSPKLNQEIGVDFELNKTSTGWRVEKIANLHQTVLTLEPTYDRDLQELALTAAHDVKTAVADTVNTIKNKIKETIADKLHLVKQEVVEQLEERREGFAERLREGPPGPGMGPGGPGQGMGAPGQGMGPVGAEGGPGILGRLRERRMSSGASDQSADGAPAATPFANLRRRFGEQQQ